MSWSEVSGVEQYLHKDYVVICHFCPNVSLFSIRFLSPKKTFIPSYRASFSLKIIGFKCEGLNFQVFTAEEAFIPLTCKRIRDASIYTSKKYRSSFYS